MIGTIAIIFPSLWRVGLLLAIPVAIAVFVLGRDKESEDHIPDAAGRQSGKLSGIFWISWIGFVACISSKYRFKYR